MMLADSDACSYAAAMRRMTAAERAKIDARLEELAAEVRELVREVAALTSPPPSSAPLRQLEAA